MKLKTLGSLNGKLRIRVFCGFFFGVFAFFVVGVTSVFAQATLNHYQPAELARDGFVLSRPIDDGHMQIGGQLHLDYARDPLVFERDSGDPDSIASKVIDNQFAAHAVLSFSLFNRLVLFAGAPINLVMTGEPTPGQSAADGFSLGDIWLGGRGRLLGDNASKGALGIQVSVGLPSANWTKSGQNYAGEDGPTVHPELLGQYTVGMVTLLANAGYRTRPQKGYQTLGLDDELTFGLGATAAVSKNIGVHVEAFGRTGIDAFFDREATPIEGLIGVKYRHCSGVTAGVAGSTGLRSGYGAPTFRLVGMLGFGGKDASCGRGDDDRDGDGLGNDVDECPDEPEDQDGYEDDNGCPDPDNDGDSILDVSDKCPMKAENMDGIDDEDGCPEASDVDTDGDGIMDGVDQCPAEAEDFDRFEDDNGCPDADNDGDTVLDVDDNCPNTAGAPEDKGCPHNVRMKGDQIVILKKIEFKTGSDVILDKSYPILEEVQTILASNTGFRIRVEGHTDSQGGDEYNHDLSERRALSVVQWFIEHEVDSTRLEPAGFGEE